MRILAVAHNTFREAVRDKVLANAPGGAVYIDPSDKNAGGFFTVPKVVE